MARRNRTPEENERRAKIRELLQTSGISSMDDIQDLFKETIAEFMENGLEAELDDELGYSKYDYKNKDTDNSRNGHSNKTLRTSYGDVGISVPRDRKGEFEPKLLKKNQTSVSQDIEEKIISMYAKGMTTGDIEAHIQDIYGIEVSDTTISRITDKILPVAKEWQQRPLETVYAVVFLDAIHYHVRSEGQIVKKAVYIAIGIDLGGKKDVLGMWVGENESAKFWATVLNGLKNRGVEDIFIACTDNLTGFSAAIEAVYPRTEIQNCIIHQLRNSSKYVSYKDLKALMVDLKAVYAAIDEPSALNALDVFSDRWDKKYPKISQPWRDNWPNLSTYFKYPQEVRRLIYTTNAIEGFNRPNGGASIFTFEIKGGQEAAWKFIDNLKIFSLLANVADVKSLVIHPATTTHSQLSEAELADQGITPSTIRLSIGTEHIDDIIADLENGFAAIQ